jgi:hypothetical protein
VWGEPQGVAKCEQSAAHLEEQICRMRENDCGIKVAEVISWALLRWPINRHD